MKASLLVLAILGPVVSLSAFARITIYTTQDIVVHVLQSKELRALLQPGQPLVDLELTSLTARNLNTGTAQTFETSMQFSRLAGGIPTHCKVTARVQSVVQTSGGITSSRLTDPSISKPSCVH